MKQKYLVSEIANYFGVSNDTIRYYDRLGILSPIKDEKNNYRYYSREDLICFSYIFELKNLGLPLKQIDIMLNHNSLECAVDVLSEHELEIEAKINELLVIKSIIRDYKKCINKAINNFNKITIIQKPRIIYKQIKQKSTFIENLNCFKELTLLYLPLFTFYIDKDLFLSDIFNNSVMESKKKFKYALSLKITEDLTSKIDLSYCNFEMFNPSKCLTSVIKFYTNKDYSSIIKLRQYIEKNNMKVDGPILLRAISFKNNIKNNYDNYEIYIPIK